MRLAPNRDAESATPGRTAVYGRRARSFVAAPELWAIVGLALVWELIARVFDISFLPPVGTILGRLVELLQDGAVWADIGRSVRNLIIGFGISVGVGLPIGLAMAQSRIARYAFEPYVNAILVAPTLVFAPIFFVVFGLSPAAIIAVIVMYSIFIIILSTYRAFADVGVPLQDMAHVFGASPWQRFSRVLMPAAGPMVLAGLRIGLARSVKGMINGEMFIAAVGLGRRALLYGSNFDAVGVFALLIIIIAVALIATNLLQFVDRRLTGWTDLGR